MFKTIKQPRLVLPNGPIENSQYLRNKKKESTRATNLSKAPSQNLQKLLPKTFLEEYKNTQLIEEKTNVQQFDDYMNEQLIDFFVKDNIFI